MKKFYLGALILLGFNVAILLTQMSCRKEASAQSDNSGFKPANLILFYKNAAKELWLANIDGSNQRKIPIAVAAGFEVGYGRLSADGRTVVFERYKSATGENAGIYSCALDGNNMKMIVAENSNESLLQDVK